MRKVISSRLVAASAVAAAMAIVGCSGGDKRGDDGITADLERDLALATAPRANRTAVVSAVEGGPTGAPSGSQRGQRAPVRVNRRAPAPSATDVVQEVAAPEITADLPAPTIGADLSESAPAPSPVSEPEHAPTAVDVDETTIVSGPSAGGDGDGQRGRRGGGIGGLIGAVIRGAVVDGDHCERHDGRRGRGGGVVIGGSRIPGGIAGPISGGIRIGGGRMGMPNVRDTRAPIGRPTYPRY
ncbi:MAG TPA: hypothetical protein VE869_02695 [Gemmatimonas sp.]|nr:hypothetical protein [Gemmatimonas sp.]